MRTFSEVPLSFQVVLRFVFRLAWSPISSCALVVWCGSIFLSLVVLYPVFPFSELFPFHIWNAAAANFPIQFFELRRASFHTISLRQESKYASNRLTKACYFASSDQLYGFAFKLANSAFPVEAMRDWSRFEFYRQTCPSSLGSFGLTPATNFQILLC